VQPPPLQLFVQLAPASQERVQLPPLQLIVHVDPG
jgi:hypothetical protein